MTYDLKTTQDARSWLRALSPEVATDLADISLPEPASRPTRTAVILERFGAEPLAWAIILGQAMTERIVTEMPEFGGDPVEFETLRSGAESAVLEAMLWLDGEKDASSSIPEEAISGNTNFARRNIPLAQVLRGVRLGHSRLAKGFFDACSQLVQEHERAEQMRWVSEVLFAFIDTFADQMAVAYAKESHRWSISAAAARSEAIRRILSDETATPSDLGLDLGYDLTREHVGLSLWFEPPRREPATPDLEIAARSVLERLGANKMLIHPEGGSRLWAWGSRTFFSQGVSLADSSLTAPDIRVAVGAPAQGVEGFRQSHRQALSAERTAQNTTGGAPLITFYSDIAVLALMSENLSEARAFVARELNDLARNGAIEATLRGTLLCYLEEESSPLAASRRLYVARNTVAYRVQRATELIGHEISERRFDLHVALHLAQQFGPQMLKPTQD